MGSASQEQDRYVLPDANAPSLFLTHPTEEQKRRTWTLNHGEWGGALTLQEYLEREPYLTTVPLSRHGGMIHWILADKAWTPQKGQTEPVLASCESIQKRVLVATPNSATVSEGLAHGIGSVYTYPEFRGNRYAGRMLNELGSVLKTVPKDDKIVCSALWSDIGKEYYAKKGWAAFPSRHVEFLVADNHQTQTASTANPLQGEEVSNTQTTPIRYTNMEALCNHDEQLLRQHLVQIAQTSNRTCVAFAPDYDTMRWHLYRDDFIASIIYKSTPLPPQYPSASASIKGALAGTKPGRRVWAVWSRSYGGGEPAEHVGRNTLYILRLVIEAEGGGVLKGDGGGNGDVEEDVIAAFTAVMNVALREARTWHLGKVDLWNPSPMGKRLIERSGIGHRWVERDTDSIPSMMWYGDEDVGDVEWVANEKYCWC